MAADQSQQNSQGKRPEVEVVATQQVARRAAFLD
jgi:hypothetical protein